MRASLVELYRHFAKETALLTQIIDSTQSLATAGYPENGYEQFIREMCMIRLHDAWARFCRELVVLSAYAQPLTADGRRVTRAPGIQNRRQVIPALLATYRRRTAEPPWHIPSDCLDAAKRLNISNYSTINNGLGLSFPQSPTDQVNRVRNFFAHRNIDTVRGVVQVARNLGLPRVTHPHLLVVSRIQPGVSVFALWVSRLRVMAQLAVR